MDSAAYNKLHKPIRASDRCDLGLRILFRSGRWGTRTLDLSRVKVLIRFSPDDATRRQTTLTRTNDNARRRGTTTHDAICGAFCGAK